MKKLSIIIALAVTVCTMAPSCKKDKGPGDPEFPAYEKKTEETPAAAKDVKDNCAYLDEVASETLSYLNTNELYPLLEEVQSLIMLLEDENVDKQAFLAQVSAAMMQEGTGLSLDLLAGEYSVETTGEVRTVKRNADLASKLNLYWNDKGVDYMATLRWSGESVPVSASGMPILLPGRAELLLLRKGVTVGALALNFSPAPEPKSLVKADVNMSAQLVAGSQMLEISSAVLNIEVSDDRKSGYVSLSGIEAGLYGEGLCLISLGGSVKIYPETINGELTTKADADIDFSFRKKLTGKLVMDGFYSPEVDETNLLAMAAKCIFLNSSMKLAASYGPSYVEESPDVSFSFYGSTDGGVNQIVPTLTFLSEEHKVHHTLDRETFLTMENFPLSYYQVMRFMSMIQILNSSVSE